MVLRGIRKLPGRPLDYELKERARNIEDVDSGLVVNKLVRVRQVRGL